MQDQAEIIMMVSVLQYVEYDVCFQQRQYIAWPDAQSIAYLPRALYDRKGGL